MNKTMMKIHYIDRLEDVDVQEGMHCVYYNPNSGGIYTGFKIYDDGEEVIPTDITPEAFSTEEGGTLEWTESN